MSQKSKTLQEASTLTAFQVKTERSGFVQRCVVFIGINVSIHREQLKVHFYTQRSQGSSKIQRMSWGKPRPFQVSTKSTRTHTDNIPQCVVVVFWEKYIQNGLRFKEMFIHSVWGTKINRNPSGGIWHQLLRCLLANTFFLWVRLSVCAHICRLCRYFQGRGCGIHTVIFSMERMLRWIIEAPACCMCHYRREISTVRLMSQSA